MNAERTTPPDHRDPKATAGLTARRIARGLPVGREDMPGGPAFVPRPNPRLGGPRG